MKSLLPILKTKLFLLGFVSACTVILATTVPQIRNVIAPKASEEKIAEQKEKSFSPKKKKNKNSIENRFGTPADASTTATVVSDKPDYAPLSTAIFTGDGFGANEEVELKVKNLNQPCNTVAADSSYFPWTVTTDDDGHFETTWTVCNCPYDSLRLRAVGLTSHDTAYAYFTDAPQPASYPSLVITDLSSDGPFCPGSQFTVYFEDLDPTHTYLAGNIFTVQLSNPGGGSFPTNSPLIGSIILSGQAPISGQITVTIPPLSGVGSDRKLRIISSNPDAEGAPQSTPIFINASPTAYDVEVVGNNTSFCPGGNAVIRLKDSETGTNYELYFDGDPTGIIVAGTGSAILFPAQSEFGTYTVIGKFTTTPFCTNEMTGSAVLSSSPAPIAKTLSPSIAEGIICSGITLSATASGGSGGAGTIVDVLEYRYDGVGGWTAYTAGNNLTTTGHTQIEIRAYRTATGSGCPQSTINTLSWVIEGIPPAFTGDYSTVPLACNPSASEITTALGAATATDGCGTPTVNNGVDGSISIIDCQRSQTRTFTATDAGGKTATISRTVTWIEDITPPGFTGNYADVTFACNPVNPTGSLGTATATDACGTVTNISSSDGSVVSNGCNRSITRTFTATDGCSNTSTISRTVTWIEDNTPPSIECPSTQTVTLDANCEGALGNYILLATVNDACGTPTITQSPAVGTAVNGIGSVTVTLTAKDACNNTSTCSFTVNKVDVTAPVINCASLTQVNLTTEAPNCNNGTDVTVPNATDNCNGTIAGTGVRSDAQPLNDPWPLGSTTITWTFTDVANNTTTCNQTVSVTDNDAPAIVCATLTQINYTTEAPNCSNGTNVPVPNALDNCNGTIAGTGVRSDAQPLNDPWPLGSTTITWTFTDVANNTTTCNQTVSVTDNDAPVIVCATLTQINYTTEAPNCSNGTNVPVPNALDNCNGTIAGTGVRSDAQPLNDPWPLGSTTITWTFTDVANNTTTCNQTVSVTDNDAPVIVCATLTQINYTTEAPNCSNGTNVPVPNALDNCNGTIAGTGVRSDAQPLNDPWPLGSTTITWTFTDVANNTTTCNQTVSVTDNDAPVIVCATLTQINYTTEAPNCSNGTNVPVPNALDNCNGTIAGTGVRSDAQPLNDPWPLGSTTITWTFTDVANNTTTCNQTVSVTDNDAPVIVCATLTQINYTTEAPNCSNGTNVPVPNALDNCNGTIAGTGVRSDAQPLNDPWPLGSTTITWTFTDVANNTTTCNQTVSVTDNDAPVIVCATLTQINYTTEAPNCSNGTNVPVPNALDNCNGTIAGTGVRSDAQPLNDPWPLGSTTITWTFTDVANNTTTCNQTVSVTDNDAPVIVCATLTQINYTTEAPNCSNGTNVPVPNALDNCNGTIAGTGVRSDAQPLNDPWPLGSTTITWTFTDVANNTTTCNQTVSVTDNDAPVIVCATLTQINYTTEAPNCSNGTNVPVPEALDNCNGTIVGTGVRSDAQSLNDPWPLGSTTVTWTFTDVANNTTTCSQTVVVTDDDAPTITCPASPSYTRSTDAGQCDYTIVAGDLLNPTASDACGTPTLTWCITNPNATTQTGTATVVGKDLYFGLNTIKWTARDGSGNTTICSYTVNVNSVVAATSLTVTPSSQQYSDKVTYVATVTPVNCAGAGFIGGTVTFKIGSLVMGTAPVATDGTATLTDDPLLEPSLDANSPTNGPLKPGNKVVSACFSDVNTNYVAPTATDALAITCEDADITYNGLSYFGVNPSTNQGTITVSAFVQDKDDDTGSPETARGDIRNATVTFKEGSSGGVGIGSANIPVALVNPANFQDGIANASKTYTLSNTDISNGGKIVEVWAGTGNYYCGSEIDPVVPVCLSLPGGDFVTGGSWIKMQNSEGSYAGTDDKRMHAAIVFKWNKSGKNLQGNATIIYKRVVNGVQKVYQIKSNSIQSMIVNNVNDNGVVTNTNPTYRMASIVTKASFRDLTDPDFPIALFGNLTLTITAWENIAVTNGSMDRVSVELVGTGSQGMIFSSNWVSGATKWQQLDGGKMQVRNPSSQIPCTNCATTTDLITSKAGEMEIIPEVGRFNVRAFPNPSQHVFSLVLENATNEKVQIVVYDALGRQVKMFEKQSGNIPIHFGMDLKVGVYVVEVRQGDNRKTLKLVKQ